MPVVECAKCGGTTNTAVCEWLEPKVRDDGKAYECYAKYENDKWVKGCSYDRITGIAYLKSFIDRLLKNIPVAPMPTVICEPEDEEGTEENDC